MKKFITAFSILSCSLIYSQYTDEINTNRPGVSYGAYAPGKQVIQLETGFSYLNDKHNLRLSNSNSFGIDYALRYGLKVSQLEVILDGTFLNQTEEILVGNSFRNFGSSNFQRSSFGAKYLIYDPWIKRDLEGPDIRSWKANNAFKWSYLIPTVSLYAGTNFLFSDSPFLPSNEPNFTGRVALITQNNIGKWVFVTNLLADRLGSEFPAYSGILTLTHAINREISVFGEFQTIVSDFYSDELVRLGGAYLFLENLQFDTFVMGNFKDTPRRWQFGVGVSYRFDHFYKEEYIFDSKTQQEEFKKVEDIKEQKKSRQQKFEIPPGF